MNVRLTLIVVVIVAVFGVTGLLVASESRQQPTAFSVELSASELTTPLSANQEACQGPIRTSSSIGGVRLWIWPDTQPSPPLLVQIRDVNSNEVLATGRTRGVSTRPVTPPGNVVSLYPTPVSRTAVITRAIAADRDIAVCVRNEGPGTTTFMGSPSNGLSGHLSLGGTPRFVAMSLLFLRPHERSLRSLLPTAFRRAALFRPGWVGAWTFWLLAVGVLLACVFAGAAAVQASRADARDGGTGVRNP